MTKRGLAKLIDFSYTDKKTKEKRPRWYIYIRTPELVEDQEFPFTTEDKLFIQVEDGKLVIERL